MVVGLTEMAKKMVEAIHTGTTNQERKTQHGIGKSEFALPRKGVVVHKKECFDDCRKNRQNNANKRWARE